jgi:hypothetical protein
MRRTGAAQGQHQTAAKSPGGASRSFTPRSETQAGWLERRTVDATGDTCWFWTRQAETALDMRALRRDDPADLT